MALGVKEAPGGTVSPILVRRVPVGAILQWRGPYGYFTWTEADGGPVLLVGAGSDVVPLMAIIRYAVARGLSVPIHLLASSTDRHHALYRGELERLAASHHWLSVTHTFTRSPDGPLASYHRRLDAAMVDEVLPADRARSVVYLCGPPDLVTALDPAVRRLRVGDVFTDAWE